MFTELAKSFSRSNLPESEVELAGEIPADTLSPYRERALKHVAEHIEMPGFRPGKVPVDVALKKVGEVALLEETVELFAKDFYPELIEFHKLQAVGRPELRITKLAPGNPVGLAVRVTLYPELTLPKDWRDVGTKIQAEMPLPATEEEVNQTLESLQKNKQAAAGKDAPLPELNDEFAKSVGAFENFEALKTQIQKGITEEKARVKKDERRGRIVEALLAKVTVAVPRIFIESELDKIMSQMREDIGRMGMNYDDYLKRVQKTEEVIRNEFREQAAKRAKLQLTLNEIAKEENIVADSEAVKTELKHALEHFPDARPDLLQIHIETVLKNEKVLKLLEGN